MKTRKTRKNRRTKIAVVTGTRAEFGLLLPVMREIAARKELTLQVVVTGLHLVQNTESDVTDAGFEVAARVPMQNVKDVGRAADVATLGHGVAGLGAAFTKLKPDVVVVLGDRIEAMAAALAASVGGICLAHLHGGDRAEGVADEAMRHAISKLAHLHFPATKHSAKRLIRMGEDPDAVHVVGSPAVPPHPITPAGNAPDVIVMQHPIGGTDDEEYDWMLDTIYAPNAYNVVVMSPNRDPGSDGIRKAIHIASRMRLLFRETTTTYIDHLPRDQFLAMLAGAKVLVGNSSAGLIEAACVKTATVNIGPRQHGRETPGNVICCDYGRANVEAAIKQALTLDLRRLRHPYGDGHTGERIAAHLAEMDIAALPVRKRNSY